jgi:hypothetical protein
MIRPLRKRHLQIWRLWAILLPLGIVAGAVVRKNLPADNSLDVTYKNEQPVLLKEEAFENFSVQLRTDSLRKTRQLVLINRKPLEVPTAAVYRADSDTSSVNTSSYVGRMEGTGRYYFDLSSAEEHFIVYDFIHQEIIERINF